MIGVAAIAGVVHGKETQIFLTEEIEIETVAIGVRLQVKIPLFGLCLVFRKGVRKSLKGGRVPPGQIEGK